MKNLKEYAIECYELSNKQLFSRCLELYEKTLKFEEKELIDKSVTIEVEADSNGFITSEPFSAYDFYLRRLKIDVPDAVAIISELPKELGLFTWEIVTVNRKTVKNKLVKIWIVPTANSIEPKSY